MNGDFGAPMPGAAELAAGRNLVWQVGALCRAVADSLDRRFNPVTLRGELTGFSRAASGHCYFSVKDEQGQIRCAMFRRAASLMDFSPRDGEMVELRGRLGVYEQRGDLQLVVESMRRAGKGALFEEFLKLKERLERQGLFLASRKRALPRMPRSIGVVTSLGAAALHDVVSALRRRVPHIPVIVSPALVQGDRAGADLVKALSRLYLMSGSQPDAPSVDVILLVRGGGSMEDLWAFNDEELAHCIVSSPVPVVCGVGHETDFTIADFCADLRAPTPTAAAELVCEPTEVWLRALDLLRQRLSKLVANRIDSQSQRLDFVGSRLGRPSGEMARAQSALAQREQRLRYALQTQLRQCRTGGQALQDQFCAAVHGSLGRDRLLLEQLELRLGLLDPSLVLQRGYAWLQDAGGHAVTSVHQTEPGQRLRAILADGTVDLAVSPPAPN